MKTVKTWVEAAQDWEEDAIEPLMVHGYTRVEAMLFVIMNTVMQQTQGMISHGEKIQGIVEYMQKEIEDLQSPEDWKDD